MNRGRPIEPGSLRDIARQLGVTAEAVRKAARDRRIDLSAPVAEIAAAWEANTDPTRQRVRGPGRSSAAMDYARQRARLVKAQAEAQELKNKVARGELLPAADVVAGWQAAIGRARALLLGVPTAEAARLVLAVRKHGDDAEAAERTVRGQLIKAIDAALLELANTSVEDPDDEEEVKPAL